MRTHSDTQNCSTPTKHHHHGIFNYRCHFQHYCSSWHCSACSCYSFSRSCGQLSNNQSWLEFSRCCRWAMECHDTGAITLTPGTTKSTTKHLTLLHGHPCNSGRCQTWTTMHVDPLSPPTSLMLLPRHGLLPRPSPWSCRASSAWPPRHLAPSLPSLRRARTRVLVLLVGVLENNT